MSPVSYVPPGPDRIQEARRRLAEGDAALAVADALTPPFVWRARPGGFAALAQLIVEQQVSVASARAIWARVYAGLGQVTPESVASVGEEALRRFGLSGPKARYVHALARATLEGEADYDGLRRMDDEAAARALQTLLGIGRWTAQAYLLFCEGRLDVLPAGDVALQQALGLAGGMAERPREAELQARGEGWRPYRGVAAHLLWSFYGGVRRGDIARPSAA